MLKTKDRRIHIFRIFSMDRVAQVANWSEGMFKFVVIISYYKIEFLPQLFVGTETGGM